MNADAQGAGRATVPAGEDLDQTRNEVVQAGRILSALGLVTAFGHVSRRAGPQLVITPAADLAGLTGADAVEVDLAAAALPAGAPAEAWAHLRIYAARPDVGAIARAQPAASFAAAVAVGAELPLLHGQACWLGETVPVHACARLLRTAELADAAAATLGQSHAMLLRGNGGLTCGATPGLAVARMWLLSVACQTWLSAAAAGTPRPMEAAEAGSWRAVQNELLPRLWLHLSRNTSDNGVIADGGLAR